MYPVTRTAPINRDTICARELENVKHLFYNVVDYDNATHYQLEKLVKRWYDGKHHIIEALAQSPSWDPERLCITAEKRVKVDYERDTTYTTLRDIRYMLEGAGASYEHRHAVTAIYDRMDHHRDTSPQDRNKVSDSLCAVLLELLPDLKVVAGMKLTRALRAIIADAGALDVESWETISWHDVNGEYHERTVNHGMQWLLARFGDCVHPRDQHVTLHLSVAPTDILYSSPIPDIDGSDYFTSCHTLGAKDSEGGCYHAGVLSYLADSCTAVLYSCDDSDSRVRQKKSTRQLIHFSPDMRGFYSARIYPSSNDCGKTIYREYRRAVQEMISEALGAPNSWETLNREHSREMISTGDGARNYPDYSCGYATPQLFTHLPDCKLDTIEIGIYAFCLNCGEELYDNESCFCERHRDNVVLCDECEDPCDADSWDTVYVDGHTFCCSTCAERAGYFSYDGEWYDREEYTTCDRCDCVVHNDNIFWDEDAQRDLCEYCYDTTREEIA